MEAQIEAQKALEQKTAEVAIDIKDKYPVQPIDEAKLREAWLHLLAYWREHHHNSTEITILDRKFEWQNPTISLILDNNLQREAVEKRKGFWIRFLQEEMKNASPIDIVGKVVENQADKVPYTNVEKWQYLNKKYPAMDLLKSKLGLDVD